MSAVSAARCSGLVNTAASGSCSRRAASSCACSRPAWFSGGSAWPWKRFSRFQSVSPCRARRSDAMARLRYRPVNLGLGDRRCLVPRSTRGIGLEAARLLVAEGGRVVTSGRGAPPAVGEAAHVVADLARPDEPERVVAEAAASLGGLDVLVNNVGVARRARFEEVPDAEWDAY